MKPYLPYWVEGISFLQSGQMYTIPRKDILATEDYLRTISGVETPFLYDEHDGRFVTSWEMSDWIKSVEGVAFLQKFEQVCKSKGN